MAMPLERPTSIPAARSIGEIRAFAKCRNERLRLPAFLTHYRALGVHRFFIVDNDSNDGSPDYLRSQPDVHLFRTRERLRDARGGAEWLNELLAEFGPESWCVTVDIDELLLYPGSERALLPLLTRHLDRHRCEALSCLLLDMYPAGPLERCTYSAGDDPLAAAPYFDAAPYTRTRVAQCPGVLIRGGMRERVFFPEYRGAGALLARLMWRPRSPCLTKIPLVRWNARSRYLYANHWVSPKRLAPESGVLLHVKFLQDFHERAVREAARGEYYKNAIEYRRYVERLERDPDLTLTYEGSTCFEETAQLVRLGLMEDTMEWTAERESVTAPSREAPAVDPVVRDQRGR